MKNLFLLIILYFCLVQNLAAGFPERIISLSPGVTENLYLLGSGDRIIANTTYCVRPKEAEDKLKVGNVTSANIEKIVSLKPDMVFAISLSNPKQIKKLQNLGIEVEVYNQPVSFAEICSQFLDMAKILGKDKIASEIVNKVKAGVNKIRRRADGLDKPKVFVQIGAKPLFTATKDSFINDYIEFAGGENIAKNANSGIYSREKVIESNPDVIIIVTMGITAEKERKMWEKYKSISAVKNNRIHILDSYKVCSSTPETFLETLKEMVEILH